MISQEADSANVSIDYTDKWIHGSSALRVQKSLLLTTPQIESDVVHPVAKIVLVFLKIDGHRGTNGVPDRNPPDSTFFRQLS